MSLIIEVACNLKTIHNLHLPPVFDSGLLPWIICFWCVCTDTSSSAASELQISGKLVLTWRVSLRQIPPCGQGWSNDQVSAWNSTYSNPQAAKWQLFNHASNLSYSEKSVFMRIMNEASRPLLPFCVGVGDKWFTFQVLLQLLFAQT